LALDTALRGRNLTGDEVGLMNLPQSGNASKLTTPTSWQGIETTVPLKL